VWDCAKMEGRNMANKARQVYPRPGHSLETLAASRQAGEVVATAGRDGSLTLYNIEKQAVLLSRALDTQEEGCPVELQFCDSVSTSPLLFYCTAFGSIVGWDLRRPQGEALRFSKELRYGLTTAMTLSRASESWLAAGTSSGLVTCWDLRFRLGVASLTHPARARVRRLVPGLGQGQLVASVQGNNEVGLWGLEGGGRQSVVWASQAPPLSLPTPSQHSVCALGVPGPASLLTGGTDCKVRYWDFKEVAECCHIPEGGGSAVRSSVVEGTEVLQELPHRHAQDRRAAKDEGGRLGADLGHNDWVTDLTTVETSQTLLVTASNDGVIKVWK